MFLQDIAQHIKKTVRLIPSLPNPPSNLQNSLMNVKGRPGIVSLAATSAPLSPTKPNTLYTSTLAIARFFFSRLNKLVLWVPRFIGALHFRMCSVRIVK